MSELGILLDLANRFNIFLLVAVAFLVGRIYTNHLPHILEELGNLSERVARLEGKDEVRTKRKEN